MDTIRYSITCRAVSAFILMASASALAGCDDDGDDKGKVDGATDTSRADGSADGSNDGLPPTTVDGGVADAATVRDFGIADLTIADSVAAADAGVKGACLSEAQSLCYEFEPDYTEANIVNHCSPMMATTVAICPAEFMGARIGRCVSHSQFGTLHTIYYKRVDPRSAQAMCASKEGGTFYAQ
jgi:hypothetical protein